MCQSHFLRQNVKTRPFRHYGYDQSTKLPCWASHAVDYPIKVCNNTVLLQLYSIHFFM